MLPYFLLERLGTLLCRKAVSIRMKEHELPALGAFLFEMSSRGRFFHTEILTPFIGSFQLRLALFRSSWMSEILPSMTLTRWTIVLW